MTAPYYGQLISQLNRHLFGPALAIGVIAATPVFTATSVSAQSNETQSLVNTVSRLERQLQALERTVYRGESRPAGASGTSVESGGAPPQAAVSQLQVKSGQVEEQLRGLTGQVEELGFKVNQISGRLDRLVADVDFRLRTLEGTNEQTNAGPDAATPDQSASSGPSVLSRSAPANSNSAPASPGSLGVLTQRQIEAAAINPPSAVEAGPEQASASAGDASVLPPGSPEERYNYARSFLMRRDFAGAEQALREFVETYPDDDLAGAAQYWLGETYYVRSDFGAAARSFADGFQRYPKSSKAPDNLLKLGMSLAALDRTEDACITLDKLASEYPKSPASIKQRAQSERTRLKC